MLKVNKLFLVLVCLLSLFFARSQDTLKIMAYNILNYNSQDANGARYNDLKIIIAATKPDIIMLCEISNGQAPDYLLSNAVNAAGVGTFTRAVFFDNNDTDNLLFYNSSKIKLKSQKQIFTTLRAISQYQIYTVPAPGDTAFMYLHMAHLKASSTPADEAQRDQEVLSFCNDIASLPSTANIIFAGDLNLKGNSEPAWIRLMGNGCSHAFIDPINQVGLWNNNPAYASIHTQSTRSSISAGCCGGSTGGMDDRFDFILGNNNVMTGDFRVKYVPGSYEAFGNDGQHFNLSLLEAPANSVVSSTVNQALFNMSDHLPVIMKVAVGHEVVGVTDYSEVIPFKIYSYYANNEAFAGINSKITGEFKMEIVDISGKIIGSKKINLNKGNSTFSLAEFNLAPGIYTIVLQSGYFKTNCLFPKH